MNKSFAIALLTAVGGGGTWAGGIGAVSWLDARYAPVAAVADVQWTALKNEIRELRKAIDDDPDNRRLKEDLQDAIDRLCRAFPDDRECKR
jgi:hypothetical protein